MPKHPVVLIRDLNSPDNPLGYSLILESLRHTDHSFEQYTFPPDVRITGRIVIMERPHAHIEQLAKAPLDHLVKKNLFFGLESALGCSFDEAKKYAREQRMSGVYVYFASKEGITFDFASRREVFLLPVPLRTIDRY